MNDEQRRARLGRRHFLAEPAAGVEAVAEGLVAYHATDPSTVFLSAWARVEGFAVADLERALYEERSLVKHLAMRRTLFVFDRPTLGAAQAAGSDRVAVTERKRLIKDVESGGLHADGAAWLDAACAATLEALDGEKTMQELRDEVPELAGSLVYAPDKPYGGSAPVAPRVLTVLSAEGRIVRATNDGRWTASRPRWARAEDWLGEPIVATSVADMVRRYLRAFGPATEADVKWWLGSTLGLVRAALAELDAVDVGCGYVLPDDLGPEPPAAAPWVALLPALDPTTMGWQERDWYLGDHKPQLFDYAGNAGQTAWCDGRIVGGWRQRDSGEVELQLLEDPGAEGRAALDAEAARLTGWLGGVRVLPRFPSPLSKMAA